MAAAVRRSIHHSLRLPVMTGAALVLLSLLAAGIWRWVRPCMAERVETRLTPAPVDQRPSSLLARGWMVVLKPGKPGAVLVYVRSRRRGGREVVRQDVDQRLAREPLTEIRIVGTGRDDNPISAPKLTRAVRVHEVLATGYDPGPVDNGFEHAGTTRLGWRTRRGIMAVDPAVIPLRSLLYVPGYGLAWAGDVGGKIKGDHVDLCFNRTEEAVAWGRRWVRVYVLEGIRRTD